MLPKPFTMSPARSNWQRICWSISIPSSVRQLRISSCLRSGDLHPLEVHEEGAMQSTQIEEIKAALWEQAFYGCTQVSCPMGQVMSVRKSKGQLLALLRGRGRWYPVESVTIE